jgi:hypothetical protein
MGDGRHQCGDKGGEDGKEGRALHGRKIAATPGRTQPGKRETPAFPPGFR